MGQGTTDEARLRETVSAFISAAEARGVVPPQTGVGVAVVQNASSRYVDSFGLRDRDLGLPVTSQTSFAISSLTKAVTATLLVMAEERGHTRMDAPLNSGKSVLRLKDAAASATLTLEDILAHRTGIPAHDCLWYLTPPGAPWVADRVAQLDPIPGAFRTSFNYTNLMYGALGECFEAVTGSSWKEALTRDLLTPLGMLGTTWDPLPEDGFLNVASPYAGAQRLRRKDATSIAAAGGLSSNAEDLALWMSFWLSGGLAPSGQRLMQADSVGHSHKAMMRVEVPNPLVHQGLEWLGGDLGYGLGWFVGEAAGHRAIFHPGLIDGYSAAIVLIPSLELGFSVVVNQNLSPVPGLLIQELLTRCFGQRSTPRPPPAPPAAQPSADLALSVEPRGKMTPPAQLAGDYEDPAYGRIRIDVDASGATLSLGVSSWAIDFTSETGGTFTLTAFGLEIPVPILVEPNLSQADRIKIPFALDPRVAPQEFVRLASV